MRRLLFGLGLLLVLFFAGLGFVGWRLTPLVRDRVTAALADRLDSRVEIQNLRVRWVPSLGVSGYGIVVRHRGRTDVPPLVELREVSADATLFGLLRSPMRLTLVRVAGLRINVPPRDRDEARSEERESSWGLAIDRLVSEDAQLRILRREPDKAPRIFHIHRLEMDAIGLSDRASFKASLTNPTPEGLIDTTGHIGPWRRESPAATPVDGVYAFKGAKLGTIKGISGRLDSDGRYAGRLDRLDVEGRTTTPDFALSTAQQPVRLDTTFKAVVDGTNGNTSLRPVEVTLGGSHLVAEGEVVDAPGQGRDVRLKVRMKDGRIEDVLRLAVKAERPLMTGAIEFTTDFDLPAGDGEVIERLALDGRFGLDDAKFSSAEVQKKIATLSQRGRGEPGKPLDTGVVSDLKGRFVLKDGVLRLPDLTFAVPGATVRLAGSYGLRSERIDFAGKLRLRASLSETTTGFTSVLLKAVDPLFRKRGAGAELPIRISGTRQEPSFGLDVKKALTPD